MKVNSFPPSLQEIRDILDEMDLENPITDLKNGWFKITIGSRSITTNAKGVEEFNKALKEEINKIKNES